MKKLYQELSTKPGFSFIWKIQAIYQALIVLHDQYAKESEAVVFALASFISQQMDDIIEMYGDDNEQQ